MAQTNSSVMAVVYGDTHTAFITEDGYAAWAVGSGIHGQLGHGDAQSRRWPGGGRCWSPKAHSVKHNQRYHGACFFD